MPMDRLPDWVKPGAKFRDETPGDKDWWTVYHVRAIVDKQAVLRYWRREKRRWEYVCESRIFFHVRSKELRVL